MSNTRVAIDPNGDTLVILVTKQDPSPSKEPTKPAGTIESPTFIEKHFLCSQKHLTLASRRASKLFSSAFKEASKQDDGLYHWNFGDVFNVQAFEVVLKIIHGKTRGVPQTPELDLLSNIASIVDDLECYDALSFCTERWLESYIGFFFKQPEKMDKSLAQLILVSFVFEYKYLFRDCIRKATRYTCEGMPTFDLPIRADIPSLFGPGSSGSSTSTGAQYTSDPRPAHGGVFGAPRVERRGVPTSNNPRTSAGLFGASTAPQPTFTPIAASGGLFGARPVPQASDQFSPDPAKNEEAPKKLVQHSCSLKSFIDPLLLVAESKIEGLKLDDLP
ncbi:hypothetical protein FPRO04_12757 [Fusarium proliferatum]|nr:hypothetical protein FPRO04_12757 [Fusarium proliferatum]